MAVVGSVIIRTSANVSTSGVRNMTAEVIAILSPGGCGRTVVASTISSRTSAGRDWGSADMIVAASRTSSKYI